MQEFLSPKTMVLPRIQFEVENKSWKWWILTMPNDNRDKNLQIFSWRCNKIPKILKIVPSVTVVEILLNQNYRFLLIFMSCYPMASKDKSQPAANWIDRKRYEKSIKNDMMIEIIESW